MPFPFLARLRRWLAPAPVAELPPITEGELGGPELVQLVGRDDPVILDIGCNDGYHSLWFLELFPKARLFAFEPDPRAARAFRDVVRDERAKLYEMALSDRDGTIDFHPSSGLPDPKLAANFPEGWHQSGSIRLPAKHVERYPWCRFEETIQVPTRRLDLWCADEGLGVIDFIWADVQGAEAELIEGGREALSRTRYFYTECIDEELYEGQPSPAALLAMLPEFEVVHRYRHDVLLRNKSPR